MPKSASTYLTGILTELAGIKEVVLTVGHGRREQELCPFECALFHEVNYVAQAHVRYSQATQLIMSRFGIFPVILVRNIPDCVVSMRDHLLNESIVIPQAYVPRNFRELNADRQFDFIIDEIVPWYASFLATWSEYDGPAIPIIYRQLIADFPSAVMEILRAVGLHASQKEIQQALAKVNPKERRYNVGKLGRGREHLSERHIARIRQHFEYYQDTPGVEDVFGFDEPLVFNGRFRPGRSR
jgi:hypothetical protein